MGSLEAKWIEASRTWHVSDELLDYLNLSMTVTFHGVLSLTGVVTNIVNMVFFFKLKLKTSMSVGLMALSFTDFWVTAFQLTSCCCFLVKVVYPDCPVDPWTLGGYVFSWAHYLGYLISCWITTMLSVERCFCVVAPFTVRQLFTKARCAYTLIIIYSAHALIHAPTFYYAEWVSVGQAANSNFSVLKVVFNDNSAKWEILADLVAGVGLSLVSQIVIFVCTARMIVSLRSTSKIRHNPESSTKVNNLQGECVVKTVNETLSPRERRLVRTILCLAVIVSVCNIPRLIATAFRHLAPRANLGAYQNLQILLWEVSYIFMTISCSLNMFVYLKLNSGFQKLFKGYLISCTLCDQK
ncbi:muscarinic acetylcholine receptor M4 [Biomphalaria pfeifferi]|uniref:Muscarinic acetylcholine receptor M4 n=1 Tax=Biomphalaria pfeifferi TaxID=112525 RepID=A0AAD8B2B6_BIOPF|nr:muscarinic acetylcholine receptor M4 [Biomphalaria pfeifferi]